MVVDIDQKIILIAMHVESVLNTRRPYESSIKFEQYECFMTNITLQSNAAIYIEL